MGATILFTSLQLRLAKPYHLVQWKLPKYTTWYGRCHLVSGGPGYVWLAEPYHVVRHLNWALPWSMEFDSMLLHFFYTIQTQICSVGCLMIANTWTYISLYFRNIAILENKQKSLYFSTPTCEHLWPSPSNLVNCAKCSHNPSKDAVDWSVVADFKSLLN